jgi:hypothetical protein
MLSLISCSPKISTIISKSYPPLDYREDVRVYELNEPVPSNSEKIGVVKIGDTGFTTNCKYEIVLEKAKLEARKAGGNAIKITKHIPPSAMESSCHRITAQILRLSNPDSFPVMVKTDNRLMDADYALFHIYRFSAPGFLVSYDLHLSDTVICRVDDNWKKTMRIKKEGYYILWARTEMKEEVPIKVEYGKEYFIRCSVTMGALVGRPEIEIADNAIGRAEYASIQLEGNDNPDIVYLKDGRQLECTVTSEDESYIYLTIIKDEREIKTRAEKSQVDYVQKSSDE